MALEHESNKNESLPEWMVTRALIFGGLLLVVMLVKSLFEQGYL